MISVEEARKNILKEIRAVGTEVVSLQTAAGRVLAEDARSRRTQPPADLSAMDGFAVKAADLGSIPTSLKIVGEVPAALMTSRYSRAKQSAFSPAQHSPPAPIPSLFRKTRSSILKP